MSVGRSSAARPPTRTTTTTTPTTSTHLDDLVGQSTPCPNDRSNPKHRFLRIVETWQSQGFFVVLVGALEMIFPKVGRKTWTPFPPIPPDDSKETAFDYFNNPYFFDEILNNGSQTYFVTIIRDSWVLQLRLNAFFQAARAEEKKDGPHLVVFFTFHIPLCKYGAMLRAYNEWKSNNGIASIYDMITAPPFGRRGLSD